MDRKLQELKGFLFTEVRYVQDEAISFDTEKFIDFKSTCPEPVYCVKNYRGQVMARLDYVNRPALISLCIIANRASLTRLVIGLIVDRMVIRDAIF